MSKGPLWQRMHDTRAAWFKALAETNTDPAVRQAREALSRAGKLLELAMNEAELRHHLSDRWRDHAAAEKAYFDSEESA